MWLEASKNVTQSLILHASATLILQEHSHKSSLAGVSWRPCGQYESVQWFISSKSWQCQQLSLVIYCAANVQ